LFLAPIFGAAVTGVLGANVIMERRWAVRVLDAALIVLVLFQIYRIYRPGKRPAGS
jgi:hypothetical protein